MKNEHLYKTSKFVFDKNNRLIVNREFVGFGSLYISNLVAKIYEKLIPKYVKGDLLDLGCGTCPLYEVYKNYVNDIVCVDWDGCIHDTKHSDFNMDLNLPLNIQKKFDTVLLSDVLEHIWEPKGLMRECYNLLNEDGIVIINTPFAYWEHETPHDYFRYTKNFYKKIAANLGFSVLELIAYGNSNHAVMRDIISKTYANNHLMGSLFIIIMKLLIKKIALNEPLGYFVVLKKQ